MKDSLLDIVRPNYSADVKAAINNGEITESELKRLMYKISSGDFGNIDPETARRYQKSVETGDRDLYGVYDTKIGEVVLYYDATDDTLDIVTKPEYISYFKADWMNPKRMEKRSRLSTKQPDQQWKEGQRREIIREATEHSPVSGRQLQLRQKTTEYAGVYPYMDYTKIAKMLSKEQLDTFKNLARERNIPIKKLFAVFGHQHAVQNLNIKNSFDYVVKHIDDPYIFAKDAIGPTSPWDNIKILEKQKSDSGTTYYLVEATRIKTDTKFWFVTTNPTLEAGYTLDVSPSRAKETFEHYLLIDKLNAKYGEKEGYRRFMAGFNDSMRDSDLTEKVEKELRKKGWIYDEEGVVRVSGDEALVRDYMWSMEHSVNLKTGEREWLRNTDYVPDDYDVEDAIEEDDIEYLIDDEDEAIEGYEKAIAKAENDKTIEKLERIKSEEEKHIRELRTLRAGDAFRSGDKDKKFTKKTANGDEILEVYQTMADYPGYYIIAKDRDKIIVGMSYDPDTGKYMSAIRGFDTVDEAYDWLHDRYESYILRSVEEW